MKKTFYTMMEHLDNTHLVKDVGMIPYMLTKQKLMKGVIVGYNKSREDFPYLDTDVVGLGFVNRRKYTNNSLIDGCLWLFRNSKKIDCLNLYHYKPSTFIWIIVYKLFNRSGDVYVKLDIDPSAGIKMKMKKNSIKYFLTKKILGCCKVVSCETEQFKNYANKKWPLHIEFIPNGISQSKIKRGCKKEKIILTVGRLGTKQKATEILIEAFFKAKPNINDSWKLVLVGTCEDKFKIYLDEKLKDHAEMRDKIEVLGEIKDRDVLDDLYEKSSIFTMPSRWEGFCLVGVEAASKGDYLLTTNLISFEELTNYGKYGAHFAIDNIEQYAETMCNVCNDIDNDTLDFDMDKQYCFIKANYSYEVITQKLYRLLTH